MSDIKECITIMNDSPLQICCSKFQIISYNAYLRLYELLIFINKLIEMNNVLFTSYTNIIDSNIEYIETVFDQQDIIFKRITDNSPGIYNELEVLIINNIETKISKIKFILNELRILRNLFRNTSDVVACDVAEYDKTNLSINETLHGLDDIEKIIVFNSRSIWIEKLKIYHIASTIFAHATRIVERANLEPDLYIPHIWKCSFINHHNQVTPMFHSKKSQLILSKLDVVKKYTHIRYKYSIGIDFTEFSPEY